MAAQGVRRGGVVTGLGVAGIPEFLRSLGTARLAAMGAVTLALIGFFVVVVGRLTTPQMSPLFTDLALGDSSAIVRQLEAEGVPFELRQDGAVVMAPSDQVARLRMRLAEGGLPSGGGVGYEIFDKGDSLSATSFLQNVNRLRAMEGELARSIGSLDRVAAARVHLVVPERPLFQRDAAEPTASIVLRVHGMLAAEQIRAIRHLAASAVPGLKAEKVSIVDDGGRLLADGSGSGDELAGAAGDQRLAAFEGRLKSRVEGIVERIVGAGRARAEVRAEIDTNRVTQTSDVFDPEGRVVRSSQLREEQNESRDRQDGVTVANQLPNADAQAAAGGARDSGAKSEEVTNYEISRTTRTEVQEAGRVSRISVAVLVDGVYSTGSDGSISYTPRGQEELDRIAALVRSAIGFDQARGDMIEVVNLRFADAPPAPLPLDEAGLAALGFTKDDLMRGAELLILAMLALFVVLVVMRPLVRRIVTPEPQARIVEPQQVPALAPPAEAVPALSTPQGQSAASRMVEMAQVNGKVRAQTLEQVGQLAERHPGETATIIRQWLSEPA